MMAYLPWVLVAVCICAEIYSIRIVRLANLDLVVTRRLLGTAEFRIAQLTRQRDVAATNLRAAIVEAQQIARERARSNGESARQCWSGAESGTPSSDRPNEASQDPLRYHELAAKAFEAAARGWHEYAKALEAKYGVGTPAQTNNFTGGQ